MLKLSQGTVRDVLSRIPPTWQDYEPDALSPRETRALEWLVAAGLVEERRHWVFASPGTPEHLPVRFTYTRRTEEAIWTEVWRLSRQWPGWSGHPQRRDVGPWAWRLTEAGEHLKGEIIARRVPLAFVAQFADNDRHVLPSHVRIESLADQQPGITVDIARGTITVDGEEYPAEPHQCAAVEALLAEGGRNLTGPELAGLHGCAGKNWTREFRRLKEAIPPLADRILSDNRKGYRILDS